MWLDKIMSRTLYTCAHQLSYTFIANLKSVALVRCTYSKSMHPVTKMCTPGAERTLNFKYCILDLICPQRGYYCESVLKPILRAFPPHYVCDHTLRGPFD